MVKQFFLHITLYVEDLNLNYVSNLNYCNMMGIENNNDSLKLLYVCIVH